MNLRFRNVDVAPSAPVETWPTEAVLAALERGSLEHWRRLARAIHAEPWGPVARRVEAALAVSRPYGVAAMMQRVLQRARAAAGESERAAVAEEVRHCLEQSGLSAAAFAERIGTSASRLSTYLNGKVIPSAALLVRMRRVVQSRRHAKAP